MSKTHQKRPPRTPKEHRFTREYLATGNATEAAARAYQVNNRDTARSLGAQNVAKLSFSEYFDKLGLDNQSLVKTLIEATKATRSSGDKEMPDWNNRLKALELCMRLKGSFQEAELQLAEKRPASSDAPELSPTMLRLLKRYFVTKLSTYQQELKQLVPGQSLTPRQQQQSKLVELLTTLESLDPNVFEST